MTDSLKKIQSAFKYSIEKKQLDQTLFETFDGNPDVRFSIYVESINNVLKNTLTEIYPSVRALVGEAYFNQISMTYVEKNPSMDQNLNNYGESFLNYLKNEKTIEHLPYICDVARWEWIWHTLFFAKDQRIIMSDWTKKLNELPSESIKLILNPNVHFFESAAPIDMLWGYSLNSPEKLDGFEWKNSDSNDQYFNYILWSAGGQRRFQKVSRDEIYFLKFLNEYSFFEKAVEKVIEHKKVFDPLCLVTFIHSGVITRICST